MGDCRLGVLYGCVVIFLDISETRNIEQPFVFFGWNKQKFDVLETRFWMCFWRSSIEISELIESFDSRGFSSWNNPFRYFQLVILTRFAWYFRRNLLSLNDLQFFLIEVKQFLNILKTKNEPLHNRSFITNFHFNILPDSCHASLCFLGVFSKLWSVSSDTLVTSPCLQVLGDQGAIWEFGSTDLRLKRLDHWAKNITLMAGVLNNHLGCTYKTL